MKRKAVTILLTLILTLQLFSLSAQAQRLDFIDTGDHWVQQILIDLNTTLERWEKHAINVFDGEYINGNRYFRPDRNITRAEFATMLVNLFDLHNETAANPFDDVCNDAWYAPFVASAAAAGMVNGVNREGTLFEPNRFVTRQETFVMVANVCLSFPFFEPIDESEWEEIFANANIRDADELANWAVGGTAFLRYHNIVTGVARDDGFFLQPTRNLTRAEAAASIGSAAETIRVEEIIYDHREPSDPPPEPLPDVTRDALGERIRAAETYLAMDFRWISGTSRHLLVNAHRRAVETYEYDDALQQSINRRYDELVYALENLLVWDKDALHAAISDAWEYRNEHRHMLTPESFQALEYAISHAITTRNSMSSNLTQVDIDAALAALLHTLANLERTCKDALHEAFLDTATLIRRWYMFTDDSFAVFRTARSQAETAYRRSLSQVEIDAARDALLDAKDNLVPLPKEVFLQRLITMGEVNIQLADSFTTASVARIIAALDVAIELRNRGGGTFDEHYDAARDLWYAIYYREFSYRSQISAFLALGHIYVNDANYTPESRAELQIAIDAAQAALDDPNARDDELQEALADLRGAIDALEQVW